MNCDLEAGKLSLTIGEREVLENEISEGIKNNEKLKSLIEENKIAQEQLTGLRLEKKEKALVDKGTIESYQEAIDSQKDILDKEELKQLKEENKQRRAERSEKIQDYNHSIRSLMDAKKALMDKQKALKGFIKETQSNMVTKFIRGDTQQVRKDLILQQLSDGKISLKDIFDPAYETPYSLKSVNQKMRDSIYDKSYSLFDIAIKDNPYDINNINVKNFSEFLKNNINKHAQRLGVSDKHGIASDIRPFAEDFDVTRNIIFDRNKLSNLTESFSKKPKNDIDGLEEYKKDWVSAIGIDEMDRLIKEAYPKVTNLPSIDKAFEMLRNDLAEGNISPLKLSNGKFVSDDMFNYMSKKYSSKNIVQNIIDFANRKSYDLSISEIIGTRFTDDNFKLDRSVSDVMRNYYKNIFNNGYGERVGTSATRYARDKIINGYGKLTIATRPITFYSVSIADRAIGASSTGALREHFTISTLPKELMKGFSDIFDGAKRIMGHGEAKEVMNDYYHIFETYSDALQQRYNVESSKLGNGNFFTKSIDKLSNATLNHMKMQDNALKVTNAKDFSIYVKKNIGKSLNELPKHYQDTLIKQHRLTPHEWEEIKKVAKDNDFITSEKFSGILANKVASIEVTSNTSAMPNDYELPAMFSNGLKNHPTGSLIYKALTMFWNFTLKTTMHGLHNAYNMEGKYTVANYVVRLMARGFVPNMLLMGMFQYARTFDIDKTIEAMESPEGVAEALLGTLSRPIMALTTFLSSPNDIGYKLSTPIIRDSWNMVHAIKSGGKAVIDGDDRKAGAIVLDEFLNLGVPGYAQTPLKSQMKEYIKNM